MGAPPFLGLSGSSPTPTVAYAGTPGPGVAPSPWRQDGGTIYYDQGGVVLPSTVTGGDMGPGTINVDGLFEDGQPISILPSGPAGGDLHGNYPNPTIKQDVGLTGAPTSTTPPPGDASPRIATTSFVAASVSAIVSEPPSGPAGGVLSGTYPNPGYAVPPVPLTGGTMTGTLGFNPGAPLTASRPSLDIVETWNGAAVQYRVIRANVTNTASQDPSYFLQFTRDAGDVFTVDKYGTVIASSGIYNGDKVQSYGSHIAQVNTAVPAGGTQDAGLLWSTTPHLGVIFGSGLPNKVMARGTWYQRTDANVTNPAFYYNSDGTATGWLPLSGGGGASVTVSDTAPSTPTAGALWWNSTLGSMFIYYQDPNTSQWVPASPSAQMPTTGVMALYSEQVLATATATLSVNVPAGAKAIELWFGIDNNVATDDTFVIQGLNGATPITTSIYVLQVLNSSGTTAQAAAVAATTSWQISVGVHHWGVLRFLPSVTGDLLGLSQITSMIAAGTITYRSQSMVPSTSPFSPTGFQVSLLGGGQFKVGSYLRCLAVR